VAIRAAYKVVTMEMHRMSGLVLVVHDDADRLVAADVVNIPFRVRVGEVLLVGEEQDRVVVVGSLGLIVHDPDVVAGAVCQQVDLDGLGRVWDWVCCDGKGRDGLLQVVLERSELSESIWRYLPV